MEATLPLTGPVAAKCLTAVLRPRDRAHQLTSHSFSKTPRRWPITISPRVAPASEFAPDQRNAGFRRQHVDSREFHDLRNRAARGHADSAPRRPVDYNAACGGTGGTETRCDLAQQIVRGAVVGLSSVAEAACNRTERHVAPSGMSPMACSRLKKPSTLDVEYQVEFSGVLVWTENGFAQYRQHAAARRCDRCALAHLVDDLGDCLRIGEVDAEIVWRAAGRTRRRRWRFGQLVPSPNARVPFRREREWPVRRASGCARTGRA